MTKTLDIKEKQT